MSNSVRFGGTGGSMWAADGSVLHLHSVKFHSSAVTSSFAHKASGGALSVSTTASITAEDCSFIEVHIMSSNLSYSLHLMASSISTTAGITAEGCSFLEV